MAVPVFCCIFAAQKNYKYMFIKKIDKSNSKAGKNCYTYRLCESYRIEKRVRHRNILNLGLLKGIGKEDFKLLCDRIGQKV